MSASVIIMKKDKKTGKTYKYKSNSHINDNAESSLSGLKYSFLEGPFGGPNQSPQSSKMVMYHLYLIKSTSL